MIVASTIDLPNMKLLLLSLLALASAEWTCDDCAEAAAALGQLFYPVSSFCSYQSPLHYYHAWYITMISPGAHASQEDVLASEGELLVAELCPTAEDPVVCVEKLPK